MPRNGGVHDAILTKELITGKQLQIPLCRVGLFVIAHNYNSNNVEKSWGFDALYLRPSNNGRSQYIFNIATKRAVSVLRCTPTPITDLTISIVNAAGATEKQPEGIFFADLDGTVQLEDYNFSKEQCKVIQNKEKDNNASNGSYKESKERNSEDDVSWFSAESKYQSTSNSVPENKSMRNDMGLGNKDETTVGSIDKRNSDNGFVLSNKEETKPTRTANNASINTTDDNNKPDNSNGEKEVKLPQIMYNISNHNLDGNYWNADGSRTRSESTIGAMFAVGEESILAVEATANKILNNYF